MSLLLILEQPKLSKESIFERSTELPKPWAHHSKSLARASSRLQHQLFRRK
ncbi:MAG: hypothetical protein QFX35_01140 [Candidatus Verstraetearchaeota archaeon]|nr:hypothetical protein [Candidatus Verstraetearchaeota archaeon]